MFLLAVVPTGLYHPDGLHAVNLACGVATAVPVLFAARNLLVSWFLSVLLVLFLPRAYGARTGPELEWGWPWTIGLTVAVGFLLYRVALRHDAVVPVLAVTFAATWPRLEDWGDAALPGFLATGAVVLGSVVRQRREADGLRRAEQTRLVALTVPRRSPVCPMWRVWWPGSGRPARRSPSSSTSPRYRPVSGSRRTGSSRKR